MAVKQPATKAMIKPVVLYVSSSVMPVTMATIRFIKGIFSLTDIHLKGNLCTIEHHTDNQLIKK
jgi:hypothetical protein